MWTEDFGRTGGGVYPSLFEPFQGCSTSWLVYVCVCMYVYVGVCMCMIVYDCVFMCIYVYVSVFI